jgi:hypothetical protein
MTRDDVITLLGYRLESRTDLGERIMLEMRLVQSTILEEHEWLPWFLESELAEASTTAGEWRVPVPDDFLMEMEPAALWITDETGTRRELKKMDMDVAAARYSGSGCPQVYALQGNYFYLFPTPDQAFPLQMLYYARDTDMAAENVETNWLKYAPDLVIACVGREVAEKHIQNDALAASFAADIVPAWLRLLNKHTARVEANQSRYMGGNN